MFRSENAEFHNARQSCYLCLGTHEGVDTEITIEYEGVLWICKGCIKSLAETAGFVVDIDRKPEIEELSAELEDAKQARNDAEHIVIELERMAKEMLAKRMERVRAAKVKKPNESKAVKV